MLRTDRIARLTNELKAGRCLARGALLRSYEISAATLKRDIAYLRDRLNMPVVFDAARGGYRLDPAAQLDGVQYELPGLWFTAEEIHALLTMQHLLANLDAGGLLGPHVQPLMKRLTLLLGKGTALPADIARRIHVQTAGARQVHLPHFQAVGSALLQRRRLVIDYHARGRNESRTREVSPQRLTHYRGNWHLAAWCHLRHELRSFSVDAMSRVQVLDKAAVEVTSTELAEVLDKGYGIFAGSQVQHARLRFTPERARWVAAERWHPHQHGHFDSQGRWLLDLPYADPRELVMDILRHVPDVEVLWPEELADEVRRRLREGLCKMEDGAG